MEILNFILYYIMEIVMIYVMITNIQNLTDKKIKLTKENYIVIFIISFLIISNNLYGIIIFRTIVTSVLSYIVNFFVIKLNHKDTFYYTLIYCIIAILIELVTSIILTNFINIANINSQTIIKLGFSIMNVLILLFIYSREITKTSINKLKTILKGINFFYSGALIILLILNLLIAFRGIEMNNISLIIISVICILFMIFSIRVIISDKYNISILTEKNNNLKDSYKAYAETIEECRELKHNLKNDLYFLKTSLPKKYQPYANDIITKYNKNYEWIYKIDNVPEGLQGLIFLKTIEAKNNKIQILLNGQKSVNNIENDYLDMCNIVGILLDNAIEACKNTNKKNIVIDIRETYESLKIKIINNFNNSLDINEIGKKNYSTKKIKSGLGLNYINNIKKDNIHIKYEIINDIFIVSIIYTKLKP